MDPRAAKMQPPDTRNRGAHPTRRAAPNRTPFERFVATRVICNVRATAARDRSPGRDTAGCRNRSRPARRAVRIPPAGPCRFASRERRPRPAAAPLRRAPTKEADMPERIIHEYDEPDDAVIVDRSGGSSAGVLLGIVIVLLII